MTKRAPLAHHFKMKLKFGLVPLIPFLIALLVSPAYAQTDPQAKDKDLPNFHQVNEHLYRGAQPTINGVLKLSKLGIKTILSLRGEGNLSEDEAKTAVDAGMHYLSVPMPDFGRPKDEQVETALGIINDPQNWPVFVHCKHGEDRTGVIIACYRISKEGKTGQEALKEAKQYGMSMFQRGMKDFIGDYYKKRVRPTPPNVPESPGISSLPPRPRLESVGELSATWIQVYRVQALAC